MQHAKGQPEDPEHAADEHGEEVAHYPFEDARQEEEDGAGEVEYSTVGGLARGKGGGKGGRTYTTPTRLVAPPQPMRTAAKVREEMTNLHCALV